MNAVNVLQAIELLAEGKYPHSRQDRIAYEGVLLRQQIAELAEQINLSLAPDGTEHVIFSGVPLDVAYDVVPPPGISRRIAESVRLSHVYCRGYEIMDLMSFDILEQISNILLKRINP